MFLGKPVIGNDPLSVGRIYEGPKYNFGYELPQTHATTMALTREGWTSRLTSVFVSNGPFVFVSNGLSLHPHLYVLRRAPTQRGQEDCPFVLRLHGPNMLSPGWTMDSFRYVFTLTLLSLCWDSHWLERWSVFCRYHTTRLIGAQKPATTNAQAQRV